MPIAPAAARRLAAALWLAVWVPDPAASQFSMEQVKSYPFPNELSAAATGARVAWAFNEEGRRNLRVAEGRASRGGSGPQHRRTADDHQDQPEFCGRAITWKNQFDTDRTSTNRPPPLSLTMQ